METLAELGAIGLVLLLAAAVAIVIAIRRSARLGPETAALSAAALGAGAYFAAHASIDWLWSFPGLTAPVIALLGMASAPAARSREALPTAVTRSMAGALAVLSLALAPLLISARLLSEGRAIATTDPDTARNRLDQSARLNPFADLPYLEAADIARRQGMTLAAQAALTKAREREPSEWVGYALLAQALLEEDPERAEAALRRARELNPREPALDALERRLRRSSR
jgi:tetratricopeptide (TPR) repeat protein